MVRLKESHRQRLVDRYEASELVEILCIDVETMIDLLAPMIVENLELLLEDLNDEL